jgi:hypothetical protein
MSSIRKKWYETLDEEYSIALQLDESIAKKTDEKEYEISK